MTATWDDEVKAGEGRPDAQEESISLYTMHSAKGLEWPVVIPVNTSTKLMEGVSAVVDRSSSCLYCKVFDVAPAGYDGVAQDEKEEIARERVRLWYLAVTRARELLVVRRSSTGVGGKSWLGVVDLTLDELSPVNVSAYSDAVPPFAAEAPNLQIRAIFAGESVSDCCCFEVLGMEVTEPL